MVPSELTRALDAFATGFANRDGAAQVQRPAAAGPELPRPADASGASLRRESDHYGVAVIPRERATPQPGSLAEASAMRCTADCIRPVRRRGTREENGNVGARAAGARP